MLEKYKDKQNLAYNMFFNALNNDMLSHAYLIDDNNSNDGYGLVLEFIKEIMCRDIGNDSCNDVCSLIDNENYPELKVIKPDGLFIKKSQLLELQQEFSKSSIYGKRKVYIIYDCDKMRAEAANSLLKFLEEPNSEIIAFLITNNINNVLPTIISRCQIIKLNRNSCSVINESLKSACFNFLINVYHNGINSIVREKEIWIDTIGIKDRDIIVQAIDILVSMYYDIMKVKYGSCDKLTYIEYLDDYSNISSCRDIDHILSDINYLIECKDSVKNNVNINLLIDSMIVNLGGNYECSRR